MPLQSINPTTGKLIQSYPEMTGKTLPGILQKTQNAFESWRWSEFPERSRKMKKAAEILRARKEDLASLMAQEMGKPVTQGRAEIEKCAFACDYFAEGARRFLADETIPTEAARSFVTFQPLGVVLAIMPWNFPFWQVFRFAAPALMAGNAAILKHASNVTGCALTIEKIFQEAGFPSDLFRSLVLGSDQVGRIIDHPVIKAVTLTGSTRAGKEVASRAGRALKKTVLELGGSDPYLIFPDADLKAAVEQCVSSRLVNSGQSCIAAKRFIVPKAIQKQVEELFVTVMKSKRMGDPLKETTQVGPLAREDLRRELHGQVARSIKKGARLLLGGEIPGTPGAFYPPTVLSHVQKGMPAYEEEIFGPVAAIIPVKDEEEALKVANDSSFGLGAAIFTKDLKRAEELASRHLEAGLCFVNAFVRSDPRLPFGGIKESGYGRELSDFGIREFVNVKTVWVA